MATPACPRSRGRKRAAGGGGGSDGAGQDGVSQERAQRRAGDGADPEGHGHHGVRAARHQPDAGVRVPVRDHHPGGRQGVLEPRQEAERGRRGRAAGHPVPHRPVLHLAAAPRYIARQKNQTPLPLIKPYSGPRLPPDRYCLTAPNYRLKSLQKKVSSSAGRITVPRLSVGAVSSRPSTPTLGTPSAQTVSVSTKVGTPVSLTGQRFTVQIPSSQTTVKAATPTTPTVQNVLINPSLIGPKNILITTNMVSSQNTSNETNTLKRKHEDDDDYDNL